MKRGSLLGVWTLNPSLLDKRVRPFILNLVYRIFTQFLSKGWGRRRLSLLNESMSIFWSSKRESKGGRKRKGGEDSGTESLSRQGPLTGMSSPSSTLLWTLRLSVRKYPFSSDPIFEGGFEKTLILKIYLHSITSLPTFILPKGISFIVPVRTQYPLFPSTPGDIWW